MNYAALTRIGDTTPVSASGATFSPSPEYATGEAKVQSLVQYFNSIGRPKAFEADVEALYAAYETAAKSKSSVVMKSAGEAADVLLAKIKDVQEKTTLTIPWWGAVGLVALCGLGLGVVIKKVLR